VWRRQLLHLFLHALQTRTFARLRTRFPLSHATCAPPANQVRPLVDVFVLCGCFAR
jgi:hypothetical protein